jgi:hypothetical protein
MASLAALYLLLGGEFIAAAQLVVYAGAIMVLFIFVIMLLNAGTEKKIVKGPMVRFFALPLLGDPARDSWLCGAVAATGVGSSELRKLHARHSRRTWAACCSEITCCRLKSPAS